jgi:hypothetical protein
MHTVEHVAIFHGMESRPHKTHQIKWVIFHTLCDFTIVVASAAEAELGALFLNCKQAIIF